MDRGAIALAKCLLENKTLKSLFIEANQITHVGAQSYFSTFSENSMLTTFDICIFK